MTALICGNVARLVLPNRPNGLYLVLLIILDMATSSRYTAVFVRKHGPVASESR